MRLLSQNYQGLDSLDPMPCYQPLLHPASFSRMVDDINISLPTRDSKDIAKESPLAQVNMRFTKAQQLAIHEGALNELDKTGGSIAGFSRTHLIIGILVHSLIQANENLPPIECVCMIFGVGACVIHSNFFFVHTSYSTGD
jgi:hypothetical protein